MIEQHTAGRANKALEEARTPMRRGNASRNTVTARRASGRPVSVLAGTLEILKQFTLLT